MPNQFTNVQLLRKLLQSIPADDSCMEWPRGKNRSGYGQLQTWHKTFEHLVHRQAWIWTYGQLPDGLFVCHHCDNPPCFRPSHLFLGSQTENMRDGARKKRVGPTKRLPPPLERPKRVPRFTAREIERIRRLYESGLSQREIGFRFGVFQATIGKIGIRLGWKRVQAQSRLELLKELLQQPPANDACLLWPEGARNKQGYGGVKIDGRDLMVHRVAFAFANGPIPKGKMVLHRCDNPACFRPSHLFLGTQLDNMRDCAAKGRFTRPR